MPNFVEKHFNKLMDEYGHDVLVVHRETEEECVCYDKLTGSADRACPFCFGLGWIPTTQRYTTRNVDGSVSDNVPRGGSRQIYGGLIQTSRNYYFYKDCPIQPQDLIVEVEWEGDQPIYTGKGIYEVYHVDLLRYKDGNLSYIKVSTKDNPIMKSIRGIQIVRRHGETYYRLGGEDSAIN